MKETCAFRRKHPNPLPGHVSSWVVEQSKLVSGQQAAFVLVQHKQPEHAAVRVRPMVVGHVQIKLQTIDKVDFQLAKRAN